jgi:NADH dehydrogenase FAD-containing subunit
MEDPGFTLYILGELEHYQMLIGLMVWAAGLEPNPMLLETLTMADPEVDRVTCFRRLLWIS